MLALYIAIKVPNALTNALKNKKKHFASQTFNSFRLEVEKIGAEVIDIIENGPGRLIPGTGLVFADPVRTGTLKIGKSALSVVPPLKLVPRCAEPIHEFLIVRFSDEGINQIVI